MIAPRAAASTPLTSGTTSTTIPIPVGTQADDILIAWVELGNIVSSFIGPTGWTQFPWSPVIDGVNSNAWAFYKRAIAGETAPAISWTTNSKGVILCGAYPGADPNNPLGNNGVNIETASQTTATAPSLSAAASQYAVTVHSSRTSTSANKSPTWTQPSGETARISADNGAAAAAPWDSVALFDSAGAVSVGSHSYTATSSATESHHKSALIFLNVLAVQAAAALSAATSLTVAGITVKTAQPALSAASGLTVGMVRVTPTQPATMAATSGLACTPRRITQTAAAVSAGTALTISATPIRTASVTLTASTGINVAGMPVRATSATLAARCGFSVTAIPVRETSAALVAGSDLVIATATVRPISASTTAVTALQLAAVAVRTAAVALSAAMRLTVTVHDGGPPPTHTSVLTATSTAEALVASSGHTLIAHT